MNTGEVLLIKWPNARPGIDYIYGDSGPGTEPSIQHWKVRDGEGNFVPFPTEDVVEQWRQEVTATTADDIKQEAQRRIIARSGASDLQSCIIKQLNASMRATELVNKRATGQPLTADEESEAAALQAMADGIKAIRAASNLIEQDLPSDYATDQRWP